MSTDPSVQGFALIDAVDTAYDPVALGAALHGIDATLRDYDWERDRPDRDLTTADDWTAYLDEIYAPDIPLESSASRVAGDGGREIVVATDPDADRETVETAVLSYDTADGYRWALGSADGWLVDVDPLLVGYRHPVSGRASFTAAPWDETPLTGKGTLPQWDSPTREEMRERLEESGMPEREVEHWVENCDNPRAEDRARVAAVRDEMLAEYGTDRVAGGTGGAALEYRSEPDVDPDRAEADARAFAETFEQALLAGFQVGD